YASDMSLAFRETEANNVGHATALLERHRTLAPATEEDITGWEWRHLWERCKSDTAFEYAKHPKAVIALRYNSTAHVLAAFSIGGEVTVWNGLTRKRVANFTLPYDFSRAPILEPATGRILYAVDGRRGAVVARDISSGAEKVLFETGSEVRLLEIRRD